MGRELKRVPLDFYWPFDLIWDGYLNPYFKEASQCGPCDGTGYSEAAKRFSDEWYGNSPFDPVAYGATPLTVDHPNVQAAARRNCGHNPAYYGSDDYSIQREAGRLFDHWKGQWSRHLIQADVDALVAAERLWDFTRVPRNEEQRTIVCQKLASGGNSWLPESNGYVPTADEVNAWSFVGLGHDSLNQHVCIEERCKREGVSMLCDHCGGEGLVWPSAEAKRLYDEWERQDPPVGPGYQLWETTSEGSPQSPVFETLDELCVWCEKNADTFASQKATAAKWKEMFEGGLVYHREGSMIHL